MARLTIPVQVRWSDIDGYGHVNNAAILTLLEEARIAAFWRSAGTTGTTVGSNLLDGGPGVGTLTLVAHQEIEYLAPLPYPGEPLTVQLWLGRLGGASLDVCYEIEGSGGPAVRAATTIVLVDTATGRPRRLTDAERATWNELVEAPVEFRRGRSR